MGIANRRPNLLAIEALAIRPRDRVLELGFGPGHALRTMARLAPFGTIYGVDQSATMLAQAGRRNRDAIRSGRVQLYQGRFDALPLPNAAVEKILAVNVIYFWDDVPRVLGEVRRVLGTGGTIAIYATEAAALRRFKVAGPDTHRLFTASELAAVLRDGLGAQDEIAVTRVAATLGIPAMIATVRKHGPTDLG